MTKNEVEFSDDAARRILDEQYHVLGGNREVSVKLECGEAQVSKWRNRKYPLSRGTIHRILLTFDPEYRKSREATA